MPAGRACLLTIAAAAISMGLSGSTARAQDQGGQRTVRDYCLKVAPGKAAEFEAHIRDVEEPLARSRRDAGEFDWLVVARGVIPAGTSARCDYRVGFGYKGLPPEELSKDGLDAALKRARLPLTADQLIAKRRALASLVATEIWGRIDGIGPGLAKDGYLRLNHYRILDETSEWVRMETTYWKPLMDAWLKEGGIGGWGVYGLWMPAGESTPYGGLTVDTFPDWNALVQGVPVGTLWPKVHPNTTPNDTFRRFDKVRSIHDVEYYKAVTVVGGE